MFFRDEKIKDPNNSKLNYYHGILSDVLSMKSVFYNGESNLDRQLVVFDRSREPDVNSNDANNNVVIEEQLKKKQKKVDPLDVVVERQKKAANVSCVEVQEAKWMRGKSSIRGRGRGRGQSSGKRTSSDDGNNSYYVQEVHAGNSHGLRKVGSVSFVL